MRSAWRDYEMHEGEFHTISSLIKNGTHRLEIWGNSSEGWWPYLVRGDVGPALDLTSAGIPGTQ